ncbi:MAG: hypothetical protein Alpg2KO_24730 [Alphaproteobacteria bacterium]
MSVTDHVSRLIACALLTGLAGLAPIAAQAEDGTSADGTAVHQSYTDMIAEDNTQVEARIRQLRTQFEQLPQLSGADRGVVAALVGLDGVQDYFSTGEMTAETPVVLASPTKWFTAAVILRLVELEELSLDQPISTWVEDLPDHLAPLTLRQLLAHTAGVGTQSTEAKALLMTGLDPRAEPFSSIKPIYDMPLLAAPQTGFKYDGRGVQLAGWVAQQATGESWPDLFDELIAEPAGLTASWYGVPGQPDVPKDQTTNPSIAGGLYATPKDIITFLGMLLNRGLSAEGERVLAPSSIDELRRLQTAGLSPHEGAGWLPFSAGYSLAGWCMTPVRESCDYQYLVGEFGTTITINWGTDQASVVAAMGNNPVHIMSFALSLTKEVDVMVSDGDAPVTNAETENADQSNEAQEIPQ